MTHSVLVFHSFVLCVLFHFYCYYCWECLCMFEYVCVLLGVLTYRNIAPAYRPWCAFIVNEKIFVLRETKTYRFRTTNWVPGKCSKKTTKRKHSKNAQTYTLKEQPEHTLGIYFMSNQEKNAIEEDGEKTTVLFVLFFSWFFNLSISNYILIVWAIWWFPCWKKKEIA